MSDDQQPVSKQSYRIVTDRYSGFEVQCRSRWWPFWRQPRTNTQPSVDEAIAYARRDARKAGVVVAVLGRLRIDKDKAP